MSAPNGQAVAAAFGAVLRSARRRAGLSQEALALDSGIDRTYPSMLELGKRQPSLAMLLALSRTLGLDAATVVRITEQRLRSLSGF